MLGENTSVFFNLNHFAREARVISAQPAFTIKGIFDDQFDEIAAIDSEGRQTVFTIPTDSRIQRNSRLVIAGITYQVTSVQPVEDGTISKLKLKI